jgi:hypothetical protein
MVLPSVASVPAISIKDIMTTDDHCKQFLMSASAKVLIRYDIGVANAGNDHGPSHAQAVMRSFSDGGARRRRR